MFEKDEAANAMLVNPIGEISGLVKLPGSKSLSNRVLLLAALASGTTVVENILDSEDIRYMVSALKTLQVRVCGCGEWSRAALSLDDDRISLSLPLSLSLSLSSQSLT